MSNIAQRITGLSEKDLIEIDFSTSNSTVDLWFPDGVKVRQSVRVYAGMIIGPADLNEERKKLKEYIPPALRPAK